MKTAQQQQKRGEYYIKQRNARQKWGILYAEQGGPSIRKSSYLEKQRHFFFLGYMTFCHYFSLCVVQHCQN